MAEQDTTEKEYSTGDFTYDPEQDAQFAKLEESIKQSSSDGSMGLIAGKYRLERVLGQGGMGKIYLATQLKLRRTVAIKVMLAPDDQEALHRFEREAAVTANLTHPNTVRIFDFGATEKDFLYLVMEHLDGIDIKTHLKESGAFAPLTAAKLIAELCGALIEAHEKGIVHRDIKPSNIMLVSRPEGGMRAKLLDFGLVKSLEGSSNRTRTGLILGSPMYMSPEQVEAEPVSPASDIYSLGLTLYTMLSNARPFLESSLTGILSAHLLRYPKPLWEILPELSRYPGLIWIVNTAVQKKSSDRFHSAAQLKQALDSFIENPNCGFRLQDGELSVTKRFVYSAQTGNQGVLPKTQSFFSWPILAGAVGLLALGVTLSLVDGDDVAEPEAIVVQKRIPSKPSVDKAELVQTTTPKTAEPSLKKQVKEEVRGPEGQRATVRPSAKKTTVVQSSVSPAPLEEAPRSQTLEEEPQSRRLTVSISEGVEDILSVKARCGEYRQSQEIANSPIVRFSAIPEERCDLRFELVSGSYVTAKNIAVGERECQINSSSVRCQ